MADQLDRLLAAECVLQVLPFTAAGHPGTDGPALVYDFDDGTSKAYTECLGGGMISETPSAVAKIMTTLNLIRAASLPPRDSKDMVSHIRSELDQRLAQEQLQRLTSGMRGSRHQREPRPHPRHQRSFRRDAGR
jgi:hypothetical protein